MSVSNTSNTVTIRTSESNGENVINVILEVEGGEIVRMCGEDQDGNTWDVDKIQFNLVDPERGVLADRCCIKVGGITRCFEC